MTVREVVYVCGGQTGTGGARETSCSSTLHDWPLPSGYVDAVEEAHWRLRNGWANSRCFECATYGWRPGKVTSKHQAIVAEGAIA